MNRLISNTTESKASSVIQYIMQDGCLIVSLPNIHRATVFRATVETNTRRDSFFYFCHRDHTTLVLGVRFQILDI